MARRLILISHGKIVVEKVPRQIIEDKGRRCALEIREAALIDLQPTNNQMIGQKRGSDHIYYAANPDQLNSLTNITGCTK